MKPPDGLESHGQALWESVTAEFTLNGPELELLEQAARTADVCARLAARVASEGELITSRLGELRTHPALVELRNQRQLLGRLLVVLRVPIGGETGEGETDQPRGAFRGFYGGVAA
jgi:hypothetical protein